MDGTIMQEMLDELFSAMEALETQNDAILQCLKNRGTISDEDFAPFLEKSANASNVRWRAARIRMNHLLAGAANASEMAQEKSHPVTEDKKNQEVVHRSSETQKDSETDKRSAEQSRQASNTGKDTSTALPTKEGDGELKGKAPDRPAKKDAA